MNPETYVLLTLLVPGNGVEPSHLTRCVLVFPNINTIPDDYLENYMEFDAMDFWRGCLPAHIPTNWHIVEVHTDLISSVVQCD